MQRQQITKKLKEVNLNLDQETIETVSNFLIRQIGFLKDIEPEYQLYAAVAIVSEIQTLPTIGHISKSKNGIKIENVMSHLGKLSKERFLDTINRQSQKYKKTPQYLKKKVEDIRYSYRFYKKYQATFQQLYKKLSIVSSSKEQFSALFWVVFLYVKNTFVETENITESKDLLILLFRMIFQRFLAKSDFADIFLIMQRNIGAIPEISLEKYDAYSQLVEDKLSQFYSQRFSQIHVNFTKLLDNYTFVERLLDDMSNAYVKDQTNLRYYNEIDELTYLQLKKNLTPQVFRKTQIAQQPQVMISTNLFFDDSDEEQDNSISEQFPQIINSTPSKIPIVQGTDGQPTPKPNHAFLPVSPNGTPNGTPKWNIMPSPKILSSQLEKDVGNSTPISKKIQNQTWLNKKIGMITHDQIQLFLKFFEPTENQFGLIFEESQQAPSSNLKTSIFQIIKEFTPKCQNYEQRFIKIMAFIVANFSQVQNKNKLLFDQMNSNENKHLKIIGVAALSCEIFNYINNSVSYGLRRHCQVFGTDVKTVFQTLELFNQEICDSMPIDLKDYLQKTTKRFFVDDIWQNSQGYKILCQNSTQSQFSQIRQNIILCAQSRIKQICRHARIQAKIVIKTQNMIKFIFQHKPYLLKNNNIDQIILCCIMSCLSINEKEEYQTLEILFCQYNSNIQFSFNSNQLGLKDQYGNQMKIIEYYNEVFLSEIQDMLTENQDQLDDFLLTPVRITKQYLGSNIEQNISKKKQLPGTFLFNPQKIKDKKNTYRQNLIKQNMEMKEEKQEDEHDLPPSPTFGRTITFGDLSGK